jgi:F0F1-type ATP synthase alpha subunit
VGGAAQTKVVKGLSGGIRTDLAQYRELAAFAQFAPTWTMQPASSWTAVPA